MAHEEKNPVIENTVLNQETSMNIDEKERKSDAGTKAFPPLNDVVETQNFTPASAGGDGNEGGMADDSGNSHAIENSEEGMVNGDDDGSDNPQEMVVLDPNHPLMVRFQAALNKHLSRQDEKVTLEWRELEEAVKSFSMERENLGVELYGVQQELARYQMLLEKHHDDFTKISQLRQRKEVQLSTVRVLYKDTQLTYNKEKKKGSQRQEQVESLSLRLIYMENAKDDIRSDIAVMRRAAEKVESEVEKAESDKQKQDLYVDRLVDQVDKLKEEMAMYEAQIVVQGEESRAAKDALMEANMEMEMITLEKKRLYQQWNSSLIGMRRRDEARAAMQEALRLQEEKILSLETEMEAYKKSIHKEQGQNEKLTLILAKTERDVENTRKQLALCQARFDGLKKEYTSYTRMMHVAEQALNRTSAEKALKENDLAALRKSVEWEYQEKVSLEDQIMERLRSQLSLDKAAQYSSKLVRQQREQTKRLEMEMCEVENSISSSSLSAVNVSACTDQLRKEQQAVNDEIAAKNAIISHSEAEIHRRNIMTERKQHLIDQYNKKLEAMICAAGGVELGPLEIQINSLLKSLDAQQLNIVQLQQLWLRQQGELVRLSLDKDQQSSTVEQHGRQLTILCQKKIRVEGEIEYQQREMLDLERAKRNMRNDIIRLNTLLHKHKSTGTDLEQSNILTENAFVGDLKDAEQKSIELVSKLEHTKKEKDRLLDSLIEAERQIMLWERKTQLAQETRNTVDSEVGQADMKAMKAEIHRMSVRHCQLMKMQEKLIQEMERAVSRRDTIMTRGEAQDRMRQPTMTKATFERQMMELRKKIKSTIQEANDSDNETKRLREQQEEVGKRLEERQVNCQALHSAADTLDGDIEHRTVLKNKNLSELVLKQQRTKYHQQVKEGRYTFLCRTESAAYAEVGRLESRLQALTAIVDRLNQEFPSVQRSMRRATIALSNRRPLPDPR